MNKENDYLVEPVAFMYTRPEVEWPILSVKKENPGSWLETPLYTHADPAEVERLRADIETMRRKNNEYWHETEALRAQLSEAHILLREVKSLRDEGAYDDDPGWGDVDCKISALSANRGPSAPSSQTAQPAKYPLRVWECVETGRRGKWEERTIGFTVSENTCSGGFLDSFTLGPVDIDQRLVKSDELTDEEVIEAMRKDLYHADGGYAVDMCPEFVVKAGRSLLKAAKEKK